MTTTAPLTVADLDRHKTSPVDAHYPPWCRTFYSPQDDVHGVLVDLLNECRRSLIVAMYGYDDDELAGLIDHLLQNPKVYVQVTLDRSQAGGVHEKALLTKYAHEMTGNSVAIGTSEKHAIMHRKMVIVDGVWRVSGSTNWSTSGESQQDNELTVIRDAVVCAEARTILDIEHDSALKQQAKAAST